MTYKSKVWRIEGKVSNIGVKAKVIINIRSKQPIDGYQAFEKAKNISLPKAHSLPVELIELNSAHAISGKGARKNVRYIFRTSKTNRRRLK